MTRHNCPNCGAPITETQCPYCGTVFYDFSVIDMDKPSYIQMKYNGQIIIFRAIMRSAEIVMEPYEYVTHGEWFFERIVHNSARVNIEFQLLEDNDGTLMKRVEVKKKEI